MLRTLGQEGPDDGVWGGLLKPRCSGNSMWEELLVIQLRSLGHWSAGPGACVRLHGKWTRFGRGSDHGDSGLLSKDPTVLSGLQSAAGTGLGGDLLFELLVFPEFWGVLGHDRLLLGPVKPLIEMDPLKRRDVLMASGGAKPLHHRVTGEKAKALGRAEEG